MQTFNFLKPNRDNIKNYSIIGSFLVLVSLIDVISNAFFKINLTSFLPGSLTTLFPLIIGLIGLNMMRIDYSGNKTLDLLNKNINTNNFNALLTLLILFLLGFKKFSVCIVYFSLISIFLLYQFIIAAIAKLIVR